MVGPFRTGGPVGASRPTPGGRAANLRVKKIFDWACVCIEGVVQRVLPSCVRGDSNWISSLGQSVAWVLGILSIGQTSYW